MKDLAADDERIVELFFARNEEAIELASKRYGRFVYSVCYNVLRQRQDSEECRSTTFLKAWERIPPERPRSLQAFLGSIARASAIDCLRSRTRKKRAGEVSSLDELSGFLADDYSLTDAIEAKELAGVLNGFLLSLPERERIIFIKRWYWGEPVKAVSRETGLSRSMVYTLLDSLKNKLEKLLKEEGYLP